jgi:hypothetical protein
MRWAWLAIIVSSGLPVALVALVLNPFTVLALGPERWRELLERFYPQRRRVVFSAAVFAFSIGVYAAHYH